MSSVRHVTPKNVPALKHTIARVKKPKTPHQSFSSRLKNATLHEDGDGNYWLCGYEFEATGRYKTAASHFNHKFFTHLDKLNKISDVDYRAMPTNDETVIFLPFLKKDLAAYTYFVAQLNAGQNANNTSAPVPPPDNLYDSLTNTPPQSSNVPTVGEQAGSSARPTSAFSRGSASLFQPVPEETKHNQSTTREMLTSYTTKLGKLTTIQKRMATINKNLGELIEECSRDGISIACDGNESLEEKIVKVGDIIKSKIVCFEAKVDINKKLKSNPSFQDRLEKAILVKDDEGNCWLKDYEANVYAAVKNGRYTSIAAKFNRSFNHYLKNYINKKTDVRYLAVTTEDDTIISLPFLKADPAAYEYFLTLLGGGKVTSIRSFLKDHGGNAFFADLLSKSKNQTVIEGTVVPDNSSNSLESASVSNNNSNFSKFSVSEKSAFSAFSSSALFTRKRSQTLGEGENNHIIKKLRTNEYSA